MAWIKRGNCRFYVRSVRRGRRVNHEYFGTGAEARLAAALDAEKQSRRAAERLASERRASAWRASVEPLDRLASLTDLLTQAALLAGGYHQHHQGEWRRRRERTV
jgi:hypothetical protein